jgi:putative membrane protein
MLAAPRTNRTTDHSVKCRPREGGLFTFSEMRRRLLILWCVLVFVVCAIAPTYRFSWAVENVPLALVSLALAYTYRVFPLSNTSYALLAALFTLHSIGAHYGYSNVPLGLWLRDSFGWERNHYDRIVHFSFGLFASYPIREVILRTTNLRGFWAYYLPLDVTVASSAAYEILEMIMGMILRPDIGVEFLGTQGDVWDAQKDMLMAVVGALVTLTILAFASRRKDAVAYNL